MRAIGARELAAAIGPSIGPCCYEVGDEVAAPFREAFGDDVVREGNKLDLWTAAERRLAAGVEQSSGSISARPATATASSRTAATTDVRRQGVIAYVG